jgi:iron complex transport system substrate-binding protein
MRIISLLPSATDMVVALGAADCVVGVTHECDAPELASRAERVTSTAVCDASPSAIDARVRELVGDGSALYTLDAVRIRELGPDVIITQAVCDVCAVRETDVRALAGTLAPRPVVVTLAATTLDGVLADLARLATELGLAAHGDEVVTRLRDRMRTVHERLRAAAAPRPTVAVIEWPAPVYAAGHWVPEMVRRAGGQEVIAESGALSRPVTAGEVAAADPAVLLMAPCGFGVERAADAARTLLAHDDWRWARGRTVWALDANTLTSRPGPRLVDGVEVLAALLHPSLFPAPSAALAVRVTSA